MRKHLLSAIMLLIALTPVTLLAQVEIPPDQIRAVVWSPDGDRLAVTYQGGKIQIVTISGEYPTLNLQADTSLIFTAAWSPDGRFLATGSTHPDNALRIWDTITGEQTFTLARFGVDILTVGWRPDGQQIIATTAEPFNDETNSMLINPLTGELTPRSFGIVSDMVWSADQTSVTMVGMTVIVLFDAADLQARFTYASNQKSFRKHLQSQLVNMDWSADEKFIAGGTGNGRIFVWNTRNADPILTLFGHDYEGEERFIGWIHDLHFDASGRQLTSIAGDGTIRTWAIPGGELIAEQKSSLNYAAAFSPYGGRLALGFLADTATTIHKTGTGIILKDTAVQIIVPDPSIEKLQTIANQCFRDDSPGITDVITASDLPDFMAQVKALPPDIIPPACAADLIAVAEAIIE